MFKRLAAIFAALILVAAGLYAGDVAEFVNLGFSDDGAFFQFAQYGIDQTTGGAYAEIYTVDNARNAFVPRGVLKASSNAALDLGQDGSGLFFNLLYDNAPVSKSFKIDHMRQGRLLYVLLDGEIPRQDLSFRDFKTGTEYGVSLDQTVTQAGTSVVSSFSLMIGVTDPGGTKRSYPAGSPSVKRQGVSGYLIRRVLLSPDERYLLVLVEKTVKGPDAPSMRYMIEPVRIR
jgi:predicted secreted protein